METIKRKKKTFKIHQKWGKNAVFVKNVDEKKKKIKMKKKQKNIREASKKNQECPPPTLKNKTLPKK